MSLSDASSIGAVAHTRTLVSSPPVAKRVPSGCTESVYMVERFDSASARCTIQSGTVICTMGRVVRGEELYKVWELCYASGPPLASAPMW